MSGDSQPVIDLRDLFAEVKQINRAMRKLERRIEKLEAASRITRPKEDQE